MSPGRAAVEAGWDAARVKPDLDGRGPEGSQKNHSSRWAPTHQVSPLRAASHPGLRDSLKGSNPLLSP